MLGFLCESAASGRGFSPGSTLCAGRLEAPSRRLISVKNRWILPENAKETVDLPDFVKESVAQIQILCTFQADVELKVAFHERSSWSLIFSPSLNNLPEKRAKSELFAGFSHHV